MKVLQGERGKGEGERGKVKETRSNVSLSFCSRPKKEFCNFACSLVWKCSSDNPEAVRSHRTTVVRPSCGDQCGGERGKEKLKVPAVRSHRSQRVKR